MFLLVIYENNGAYTSTIQFNIVYKIAVFSLPLPHSYFKDDWVLNQILAAQFTALPSAVSTPERTALWEQRLRAISEQQDGAGAFQQALLEDLRALLHQSDAGKLRQSLQTAQGAAGSPAKLTSKPKKSYTKRKSTSGSKK
ncbi:MULTISPECIES: hypothetical protein [Halomonas]|uniref:hypothetical protein n=1 Tax=Halomonas TaxID=2745 RepID=UPI003898DC59